MSPPPPDDINWTFTQPNQIQFEWNSIADQCLTVHYVIIAKNCGNCLTSTTFTNATCTYNVLTDDNITCSFAIETVICENITGKRSNPLYVRLKGTVLRQIYVVDSYMFIIIINGANELPQGVPYVSTTDTSYVLGMFSSTCRFHNDSLLFYSLKLIVNHSFSSLMIQFPVIQQLLHVNIPMTPFMYTME